MVVSLKPIGKYGRQNNELPLLVELVGPAGSGKTSLFHALTEQSQQIQPLYAPDPSNSAYWYFFTWNSILIIPFLIHCALSRQSDRFISRREIASISILKGWNTLIKGTKQKQKKFFLMDQGPIFLLTEYRLFGPKTDGDKWTKQWWTRIIQNWANIIDIVIMLDAPTPQLFSRVNSRTKWHIVKNNPEKEVETFYERYRNEFQEVTSELVSGFHRPEIIHFNTEKLSINEISYQLISRFGLATGNSSS